MTQAQTLVNRGATLVTVTLGNQPRTLQQGPTHKLQEPAAVLHASLNASRKMAGKPL